MENFQVLPSSPLGVTVPIKNKVGLDGLSTADGRVECNLLAVNCSLGTAASSKLPYTIKQFPYSHTEALDCFQA